MENNIIENKNQNCCFITQSNVPYSKYNSHLIKFKRIITLLIKKGVVNFYIWGVLGFDMTAGKAILELKQEYPQIKLTVFVPYKYNRKKWTFEDRKLFDDIKNGCDTFIYIDNIFKRRCKYMRIKHLFLHCDNCISYITKYNMSITAYMIQRAKQEEDLRVYNLPDLP